MVKKREPLLYEDLEAGEEEKKKRKGLKGAMASIGFAALPSLFFYVSLF
jgi:hypothetical protein